MKRFIIFLVGLTIFSLTAFPARALTFDLIAPEGQLQSGQDVQFTIDIDTEGASLATTTIGMTYVTTDLEYVSVAPGTTFTTVAADVQGEGKIVFTGSSSEGYSGAGSFAIVTFKIIAPAPGSSQLCALFNPEVTPTPAPTNPPPPGTTATPIPPADLPTTGSINQVTRGTLYGFVFFAISAAGFFFFKKL